jgi:hypothetical protein
MSGASTSNRWWENYLVRYFMPSIAGIAIVGWLSSVGGGHLKNDLFFGLLGHDLSAPTLTLLVLYGNLFCYVASYPILGFHATRVIDYPNSTWRPSILDGYLLSLVVGLATLLIAILGPNGLDLVAAFVLVSLYSIAQLARISKALKPQPIKGLKRGTSLVYGYIYVLAKRRGVGEKITSSTTQQQPEEGEESSQEEITEHEPTHWQREVIDTYRHMREHGNSAFIFFLELVLASLCYLVLSMDGYSAQQQLSRIGILFAVWALPAVAIHMFSQTIERRFSLFDRKLQTNALRDSQT